MPTYLSFGIKGVTSLFGTTTLKVVPLLFKEKKGIFIRAVMPTYLSFGTLTCEEERNLLAFLLDNHLSIVQFLYLQCLRK